MANAYAAINNDLAIVPALNKIDMQASRPEEIREEILATLGIDPEEVLAVSGKTGQGVPEIFRAIIDRVPPPSGDPKAPLRALIFDSKFDDYQGVVVYMRVIDGVIKVGQKIRLMAGDTEHEVISLGQFRPREVGCDELGVGQVGYVTANIKRLSDVRIGDTITDAHRPAAESLPGYQEPAQVVFCGLFPATHNQFEDLRTVPPEALAQRRELHLRARDLRRARLRLPLRVPRHAPHGDRPAAARAREQSHARANRA